MTAGWLRCTPRRGEVRRHTARLGPTGSWLDSATPTTHCGPRARAEPTSSPRPAATLRPPAPRPGLGLAPLPGGPRPPPPRSRHADIRAHYRCPPVPRFPPSSRPAPPLEEPAATRCVAALGHADHSTNSLRKSVPARPGGSGYSQAASMLRAAASREPAPESLAWRRRGATGLSRPARIAASSKPVALPQLRAEG